MRPLTYENISRGQLEILTNEFELDSLFYHQPDHSHTHHNNHDNSRQPSHQATMAVIYRDCYLLFVHSPHCPFSIKALPKMRALARAYPQLRFVAVTAQQYVEHRWSLRMFFVPKLKLVVDSQIVREYTGSDTDLDSLIDFVWLNTSKIYSGVIGTSLVFYAFNLCVIKCHQERLSDLLPTTFFCLPNMTHWLRAMKFGVLSPDCPTPHKLQIA